MLICATDPLTLIVFRSLRRFLRDKHAGGEGTGEGDLACRFCLRFLVGSSVEVETAGIGWVEEEATGSRFESWSSDAPRRCFLLGDAVVCNKH